MNRILRTTPNHSTNCVVLLPWDMTIGILVYRMWELGKALQILIVLWFWLSIRMSWGAWKKYVDIRGSNLQWLWVVRSRAEAGHSRGKSFLGDYRHYPDRSRTLIYTLLRSITGEKTNTQGDKMTLLDKPWERRVCSRTCGPAHCSRRRQSLLQERGHAVQCSGWACLLTLSSIIESPWGQTNHLFRPSRVNWNSAFLVYRCLSSNMYRNRCLRLAFDNWIHRFSGEKTCH